ncbi:hypothetical protein Ddye_019146 [Dipteronia dyeriana]|uniref:PGG domain-containing protein n=1 Tax=Dipteronia dyeriana TaxID=168575 RepID=A0AAD9WUS5_9ROSI|nr:hypothetical protein Ddye_019146 [Dipteronia dyeriana]
MEATKSKVNDLFERAMRRQWDEFVEAYVTNPDIREARITNSGDTALHIAVSYGEIDVVLKLVERLGKDATNVLEIENDKGNTALHRAATLGIVDICHCIASKHPKLIASRNKEGETPLFLAAHHGKEEAFLCLDFFGQEKHKSCRKSNGDTILHAAISGEYFSLAFQIIRYYPDLVNSVDAEGQTPLHILARKPNAFHSSSRLRPFDRIIYHCMFVDDKLEKEEYDSTAHPNNPGSKTGLEFLQNYETCMTFFRYIKCWIQVFSERAAHLKVNKSFCLYNLKGVVTCMSLITGASSSATKKIGEKELYPPNCTTFLLFLQLTIKALLIILGIGTLRINKIIEKKERHTSANQIMNELVDCASTYMYKDSECNSKGTVQKIGQWRRKKLRNHAEKRPLLIAAKMGVVEMVEKILDKFPVAVQDVNSENKNIVLLAVENRQTGIYQLLMNRQILGDSVFRQLDDQGNSALHLAATFGEYRPWLIPGAALQMQWEIKWYRFVKKSMPLHFFVRCNVKDKTPKEIFTNTHKELIKEGREWLTKTSESCSVVAALIATVAYATSATIPGGVRQENGKPFYEDKIQFKIFAISSLVALCFSVTALVFFLAILTSRYEEDDFAMDLPKKLLLGLTSLFTSIASILISFCSAHFFILKDELRTAAYPIYAVTCLPMTFFAIVQLPLYFDLIWAIFKKVPQRSYKKTSH